MPVDFRVLSLNDLALRDAKHLHRAALQDKKLQWPVDLDTGLGLFDGRYSPTKLVVAGDWHGESKPAARALTTAAAMGAEAVLQLGDFGIWPGPSGERYLQMLERMVHRTGVPILFVDGNHEDFPQLYSHPVLPSGVRRVRAGVLHLPRGFVWSWAGTRFAALGGATSVDRSVRRQGVSWWPEERITVGDVARLHHNLQGGRVDVLVTHDAPAEALLPLGDRSWIPEAELRDAAVSRRLLSNAVDVASPQLLLHGHYHQRCDRQAVSTAGVPYRAVGLNLELQNGSLGLLRF